MWMCIALEIDSSGEKVYTASRNQNKGYFLVLFGGWCGLDTVLGRIRARDVPRQ